MRISRSSAELNESSRSRVGSDYQASDLLAAIGAANSRAASCRRRSSAFDVTATRAAAAVTVYAPTARARASYGDVDTIAVDAAAFAARDGHASILTRRIARDACEALAGTAATAAPRRLVRARGRTIYVLVRS